MKIPIQLLRAPTHYCAAPLLHDLIYNHVLWSTLFSTLLPPISHPSHFSAHYLTMPRDSRPKQNCIYITKSDCHIQNPFLEEFTFWVHHIPINQLWTREKNRIRISLSFSLIGIKAVKIRDLIWPRLIGFSHAMSYHNLSQFSTFRATFSFNWKILSDQTEEIFSKFWDSISVHASMNTMTLSITRMGS